MTNSERRNCLTTAMEDPQEACKDAAMHQLYQNARAYIIFEVENNNTEGVCFLFFWKRCLCSSLFKTD